MQEILVEVQQKNGTIGFNFDEIKKALSFELETYKNMVFTEDSKTYATKTVANLRKLKKQISDKRIEVKKNYMQPYTEFETKVKELDKLIDEPIKVINDQVEAFEQKRIEEKRTLISSIYEEVMQEHEDLGDYIKLDKIYDPKWENATISKKSIYSDIENVVNKIVNDLETIKGMESEYEDKALERYKKTGELSDALLVIRQWEKQKEEILRAEAQKQKVEQPVESTPEEDLMKLEPEPVVAGKAVYEVIADAFQIAQLECDMKEYGIEFRRIG
ncbi:DUF1351 domain-containing protein [Agathobacter rectalis]|uniref:DUF1351 domain-containing protein n=1 Tax=Agathobacter rectalis TaxID=39491 RepID=UPI0034A2AC16